MSFICMEGTSGAARASPQYLTERQLGQPGDAPAMVPGCFGCCLARYFCTTTSQVAWPTLPESSVARTVHEMWSP
jgi:hypothetical protein